MLDYNTVFLSLDIETGGYNKPIFAIGCAVFKIDKDTNKIIFLDEKLFNFKVPTEYNKDYYNIDTWENFWSKNVNVLFEMNKKYSSNNEKNLIYDFYSWWFTISNKYEDLRIVTDSPTFDVGYTDSKIMYYLPFDENTCPLVYQWKEEKYVKYISTIDYNTFELLFEMTLEKPYDKLNEIIGSNPFNHDHNPLNDAKYQAYQFSKIFNYMQKTISF